MMAVVPGPSAARTSRPIARHHLRRRLVRHAAREPLRLRLPAADDFSGGRGDDRDLALASTSPAVDRPRTAIDYRLAPRGPVGSLGLLRPGDTQAAPPAYGGPTATLRRGYPEVTAGARLSYPF